MRPVVTIRTSRALVAPAGMEDHVATLPSYVARVDGVPFVVSEWELDDDERARLLAGGRVELAVMGLTQAPVMLSVRPRDVDTSDD